MVRENIAWRPRDHRLSMTLYFSPIPPFGQASRYINQQALQYHHHGGRHLICRHVERRGAASAVPVTTRNANWRKGDFLMVIEVSAFHLLGWYSCPERATCLGAARPLSPLSLFQAEEENAWCEYIEHAFRHQLYNIIDCILLAKNSCASSWRGSMPFAASEGCRRIWLKIIRLRYYRNLSAQRSHYLFIPAHHFIISDALAKKWPASQPASRFYSCDSAKHRH